MLRRPVLLVVVAILAAAVPSAALAARVHVRVEGVSRTLFGPTEPVLDVKATALDALEAASLAGEFYYHVTNTSFGPFVDQIGRYPGSGNAGWVFKVDGASPPVGADKVTLKDGDRVLWYYADFSTGSGPPTLRLTRTGKRCYHVLAEDDNGKTTPAAGALLHVGARTLPTRRGTRCIGRHPGLVRATAPGAVRSNALR